MTHRCIDDETIAEFVAGALSEERRAEVELGIDACEACRALVGAVVASAPVSTANTANVQVAASSPELDATWAIDAPVVLTASSSGRRFVLERAAGRGAMGAVYRATDLDSGAAVAVKLMLHGATDPLRVARETRLLAELSHPSIVRYVDHGSTSNGHVYLVMEWIEGVSLADRLRAGRLTIEETLAIGRRVAVGLGEVHERGVVHRDIKPGNLMLVGGVAAEVKIVDFGIAHEGQPGSKLTVTGAILGTPGYMAPEQARGDSTVGPAADLFALGAVLYHALTGRPPFADEDMLQLLVKTVLETPPRPSHFRPDIPRELDDLVVALLAKKPADRPSDARKVHAALVLAGERLNVLAPQGTSRSLTGEERRLVSVVVARAAGRRLRFSAELAEIAAKHGGKLDAMVDGSLLVSHAGSNAPTDDALRAARCALAFKAALPDAAVSLATGRGRFETGDNAQVLARLAAIAPSVEGVGVDEVTAGFLDTRFELAARDKGFELRRELPIGEEERTLLGKPSPCVGRDRELAAIDAIFHECLEESVPRKAIVVGDPGIGKSRLRRELVRRLDSSGRAFDLWLGHGDSMSAGSPFSLVAPALLRAAGIGPRDPAAVRRERIVAKVARRVVVPAEAIRIAAFLGESAGVAFSEADVPALRAARADPMLMADRIQQAWCDFLAAECAVTPIVFVVEDLHWGDRASVQVLAGAVKALESSPLFVLAFARPEARDRFPEMTARQGAEEHNLRPLTRRASEDLVRTVLGDDLERATIDRVVDLAQGNAFFLEELIRAVADGRAGAPPETVLGMMEALLAELDGGSRRLLRAASIFGGVFWTSAIASLLGRSTTLTEIEATLAALAGRELVTKQRASEVDGEDEYRFRHALLREAAYATLTEDDRRDGHARAGAWLETRDVGAARERALHFDRGGHLERAAGYYLDAAEQALAANDPASAKDLAERALDLALRVPPPGIERAKLGAVRGVLAAAHRWTSGFADAEREGLAALDLLERASARWFAAASIVVHAARRVGHPESIARVHAAAVGVAAREGAAEERVRTMHALLATYWLSGDLDRWRALAAVTLSEAPPTNPLLAARHHQELSRVATLAGDLGRRVDHFERAVELANEAGDLRTAGILQMNLANALMEVGDWERAARIVTSPTLAAFDYFGQAVNIHRGRALHAVGELEPACEALREGIRRCVASGDRRSEGGARMYLAEALLARGDFEAAATESTLALESLRGTPLGPAARAVIARVLLAQGRIDEARVAASEARRELDAMAMVEEGDALVHLVDAEAARAAGDLEGARAAIVAARDRLLARASKIVDADYRAMFLARVDENAKTLELVKTLLG